MRLLDFLPWRSSLKKTQLPGFDPIYYLYWYPDVRFASYPPLEHYLQHGWKEGRDPSAGFSTLGYLAANPDVVQSGANPLVHYVNVGFAEGRSGHWKDPGTPAPGTVVPSSALKMQPPPAAIEAVNVTLVQEEVSEAKVDEPTGEVDVWGLRARKNLVVRV
ncbi:hypothetical protein [Methylobacterium sp. Leaf111]|uniref:hypothetical protein n=1 Tax=Methylobacterium sp. Leaf111 TaxID=1736257 RepID=UPI000B20C126